LTEFLQALINAGYFLVLTGSFEAEGTYLIAEPSLHDKPELVQKLFTKCLHRVRQHDEDSFLASAAEEASQTAKKQGTTTIAASNLDESGKEEDVDPTTTGIKNPLGNTKDAEEPETQNAENDEPPRYLLILTPRDAFMWTGKVMMLAMERIDVNLKDRRLRLIADGPERRLEMCKKHLYSVFGANYAAVSLQQEDEDNAEDQRLPRSKRRPSVVKNGTAFPLEIVDESLAHMSTVQAELRRINKGVYILSDSVNRAVPKIRRNMRGRRKEEQSGQQQHEQQQGSSSEGRIGRSKGGDCDDLIQNCFAMAAEQGFRAMPFIESARLRGQMTLALASLSIDWVAFICDDCEPSDRKTFKFAVAALENAMHITQSEYIFDINEEDFMLMRSKVASCVGLLISHFDILGARSSVAKAKEEEERLERERAERSRALEMAAGMGDTEARSVAAKLIAGSGGAGAPPMLGRADSGMQATEERWVQKVMEWDEARHAIEAEQRLIGRVLDDTRLEDQGLQFLASSSSRIQIRWQQGRFIGGGTFGTVYLAVNLDSGGLMAVKEIRFQDISSTPGMYKQIKDEMSVMEMLSHPNIVEYYGIEVHRDKVYIFEEYCQGGSLAQLLEHGRIEDEMVMQVYTLQMLDGLVYLHSKGVVHRDIKPDNILLDHMGVIKFVDFGAAKVLAKNSRTIQRSRRPGKGPQAITGMLGPDGKPQAAASLQGTPMYMSPEVIKGESRGRRGAMDVWSLGCVVLEFATGKRPWSQLDNEWAIMFHIGMAQQHPPLPEPGQLSDLGIDFIRNCLVIDPYERPSAAEMREHDWIKNLVEALNAANEEEAAAIAAEVSTSAGPSTGTGSNYHGTGSGMASLSLSGEDSSSHGGSLNSNAFTHNESSAAGVAAMVATPGTRSINGFNFSRPSARSINSSNSTFSRSSFESTNPLTASIGGKRQPLATPSTAATTNVGPLSSEYAEDSTLSTKQSFFNEESAQQAIDENEAEEAPVHHPGRPSHMHPGYDALVADLVYRREEEESRRMTSSDI
jgi:mitogen-activated protein kinase kinase kinase